MKVLAIVLGLLLLAAFIFIIAVLMTLVQLASEDLIGTMDDGPEDCKQSPEFVNKVNENLDDAENGQKSDL